jgi:hypothetical protein
VCQHPSDLLVKFTLVRVLKEVSQGRRELLLSLFHYLPSLVLHDLLIPNCSKDSGFPEWCEELAREIPEKIVNLALQEVEKGGEKVYCFLLLFCTLMKKSTKAALLHQELNTYCSTVGGVLGDQISSLATEMQV